MDLSSPALEQPEAWSEVVPVVEPVVVVSVHNPEAPASLQREQESAAAPMRVEE